MRLRKACQLGVAVVLCAAVLAITVLWNDLPGSSPDCPGYELPPISSADVVGPYVLVDCFREVSLSERVVKLLVALIALSALAVYVSTVIPSPKVWPSAVVCALSAVIAVFPVAFAYPNEFGWWPTPDPIALLTIGVVSALLGALASWAAVKWWPNKSLERTREG